MSYRSSRGYGYNRRRGHGRAWIVTIVAVLVLGGGGGAAWWLMTRPAATTDTGSSAGNSSLGPSSPGGTSVSASGSPSATASASESPTASPLPPTAGPNATADEVAQIFANDWATGQYDAMTSLVANGTDPVAASYRNQAQRLGVTATKVVADQVNPVDETAALHVTLTTQDFGDVSYDVTLNLTQAVGQWKVDWHAQTVYPGLGVGQKLDVVTAPPPHPYQDRNGKDIHGADAQLNAQILPQLGGTTSKGGAAKEIAVVDGTGAAVAVVATNAAPAGPPVTTTLDLDLQAKAEQALATVGAGHNAGMVVMDTASGDVLAVANMPGLGSNRAMRGTYAPGSMMKVITATALLQAGLTPDSTIPCQSSYLVQGKKFVNDEPLPAQVTMTRALALSCNTAFIQQTHEKLNATAFEQAAAIYGFNRSAGPISIPGFSAYGGSVPNPTDDVTLAADAIGQGKVTASPLQMASVAAGVASGTWHQPRLLMSNGGQETHQVPHADSLQAMMRQVVADPAGTGHALASVPGGPVFGKTGTPQVAGAGGQLTDNGWFMGWQGHLAFAVVVEGGASGAEAAVPVVKNFLTLVNGGAVASASGSAPPAGGTATASQPASKPASTPASASAQPSASASQ